jgi:hypothetical protein
MLLKYFDGYVRMGLKPIALHPLSKKPVLNGWNKNWSVNKWRHFFETDTYNMGILLGDIVDVEGDTPQANAFLAKITKNIPHPTYRSSKSTHHLFINPDASLTRQTFKGIEFRAHNHQSVVPPSKHLDGACYKWSKDTKFPIPEMPQELVSLYLENKKNNSCVRKYDKYGKKTQCNCCNQKFYINRTRLKLEVYAFRQIGRLWMCRKCRDIDIREACRKLRKNIKSTN